MTKKYCFTAKVWLYPGEAAQWHFVTLPKELGQQIKTAFGAAAKGFGSIPVAVTVGDATWETSIFPDKYSGSYILPLKAAVRRSEAIFVDEEITVALRVRR